MDVRKVEAKVVTKQHLVKNHNLKLLQIKNVRIRSNNFKLIHKAVNTNDIQSIRFDDCTLVAFPPSEILLDLVKNLTSLCISECSIAKITCANLRGLGLLKELFLRFNSIESLPKGLFMHTPNLEIVSFRGNRIKEIDENILDPLKNLKYFNLYCNLKINVKFDSINNNGDVTLEELKEEIKKCRSTKEIIKDLRREIAEMKGEIHNLKVSDEMLRKQVAELKTNCTKLTAELNQLKAINEVKPLDFTVVVNGKNFQVNKDILTANSPVLAKLIGKNHDADRLVLRDISGETFEEILKFMMTKNPPREAANLIELYAASARLEMKVLMELTAEILMEKVNPENALDIMNVCKKFNHKELSKKALRELNKKFGEH